MANYATPVGFHYTHDASQVHQQASLSPLYTKFTYTFENFFHPFIGELIAKLNQSSLPGMLDAKWQDEHLKTPDPIAAPTEHYFNSLYHPQNSPEVQVESFAKNIDVALGGPYANYNWELLFHIPLTIAVHLSKNQRFAEAQRWFHYIFDPTSHDPWRFLGFRQTTPVQRIEDLLALLSKPECTGEELDLKTKILSGYEAIKNHPFQPHAVARTRILAYQYCVVMKYLDNLIAWGDSLFMQDTIESINEATQCYVLAANLLGPRPQQMPPRGAVHSKSFAQLKAKLDPMGNALVDLEGQFPFNFALPQTQNTAGTVQSGPLFGIGRTLYFCIPRNDKLLTYWDTVADRLFKIRHCMNIEGVVRQLALFDPPLDPGMLVKAAAAGIDIGSIVSGLNQPIGPVRCLVLIQKALELAGEVRGLGNALLAALEKGEGERLALLRQGHEIKLQQMTQDVRFLQWKTAEATTESLLKSRASVLERYRYYQRLLSLTPDSKVAPETLSLARHELTEENFDEAYNALVAQYDTEQTVPMQAYAQLRLAGETSPTNQSGASGKGALYLNSNEAAELNRHLPAARDKRAASAAVSTIASVLTYIPDFDAELAFWGLGASSEIFGGAKMSDALKIIAGVMSNEATWEQDQAGIASRTASYERRADDWILQNNLAARELMQIGRQILSSLIAEQIAHHEYLNIKQQIAHAQEVEQFLHDKFTNEELYGWMQGEIARLYYEYYRFAFDTARKAERTMKQELMRPEVDATDFIKFNYWDGGRKGLLSGEALYLDIKRMEMAYHENNKREIELTRHISLRQLDPLALLTLKVTGTCEVAIPEWLYDRDCPGHYMRRIKTVAVSIPSVVGPYTSVNCTLTLLRSSVRKSPSLKTESPTPYTRLTDTDDDRFVDYVGSVQSIVTSGGSNDSGMFEPNLHDERFLPFEGAGALSTWRLELPRDFPPFDYMTISDVILHMRYTARQGGDLLGTTALNEMRDRLKAPSSDLALFLRLPLLFSLPHDFPTEWSTFVHGNGAPLAIRLRMDHFPYMVQNQTLTIDALDLYAQQGAQLVHRPISPIPGDPAGDLNGPNHATDLSFPEDTTSPQVLTRTATQVFLIVRYGLA
jgi:hypothetical protein